MKIIITIAAWLAIQQSVLAIFIYEWEDPFVGSTEPYLQPYSGRISFFDPFGTNRGIDAISELTITLSERRDPFRPTIPTRTWDLSEVILPQFPFAVTWDAERIISMVSGLSFRDDFGFAQVDSFRIAGFWPIAYEFDQEHHDGQWKRVPDGGSTLGFLALGIGAMFIASYYSPRSKLQV